ncbi:hypothetical protein CGLO_14063 [Colletotrichum gloeosporioides Cg-14]|uniref:Uncharacterized protein n=1 Tax=Colletotrichum gloeosporioides (strain Cg-14) TaxID=1237896 RepID=T0L5L5_COLGC|nr:hypothetical protein CGLO_14063 [Colletotrichum gloeosporioides Cg-14]
MINQGVQVKADSVEKHLANEKLVTFLEQDIERTEDEIDDIMLVLKEVLSSGRFTFRAIYSDV